MNIVTKIDEWRAIKKKLRGNIGFVPTMGNIHEGHLSLGRRAKAENDVLVFSIFINPTQFNQSKDFELYPRTMEADKELLKSIDVNYLLLPNAEEIYPDNYSLQISETDLSTELEGQYRPGHFTGMLTVVLKLLNWIQPHRVYLGEKDYQQFLLVKKMVNSLFLPIDVIPCPTVRAADGLALSSRNSRLKAEQRKNAIHFPKLLQSSLTLERIIAELTRLNFKIDYVVEKWQRRLGAVWLDDVRLIDNVSLNK